MRVGFRMSKEKSFTNMTTFVENVVTEPPRVHPPASLLFSASQGHRGLCLLLGLEQNPRDHCK